MKLQSQNPAIYKNNQLKTTSFGSLKANAMQKQLTNLTDEYMSGPNPVIKDMKEGFIPKLVKKFGELKNKTLVIGITGESASGKSEFVKNAMQKLKEHTSLIHMDNYYNDVSKHKAFFGGDDGMMAALNYSFDEPKAVNLDLLKNHLHKLSQGENVKIPKYDFGPGKSTPEHTPVEPKKVLLLDGIFALNKKIKPHVDAGIYVETADDVRKARWMERAKERCNTGEEQLRDVDEKAKIYIKPTRNDADVVLSGEAPLEKVAQFVTDLKKVLGG